MAASAALPFIAAFAQAAGNVADQRAQSETAFRQSIMNFEMQNKLNELAYQRQVEFWHQQNAYNSPAEQMKRFGAAGLNPHLIYSQGNPGNAASIPQYQPPHVAMRFQAPAYGAAVSSVLPTLMEVGTWMQNMRASEVQIEKMQTETSKAQQLIEYLYERNPRLIQELDNRLSLFPYQRSAAYSAQEQAQLKAQELGLELQYKFGAPPSDPNLPYGGTRALEYYRKLAEMKLKQAQSSWTDFNITNPQALVQLVLSGAMSMAGQQLRLSTHRGGGMGTPPKRVKTFYENGRRRSQVVDY